MHGTQQLPVALILPASAATSTSQQLQNAPSTEANAALLALPESGGYVASKSGAVYHLPWCSGAKRIKEENRIYFASKEEAERAGYRPAANCKGI